MVKHTQTIWRQQPTNCLSVFDLFVALAFKGLKNGLSCYYYLKEVSLVCGDALIDYFDLILFITFSAEYNFRKSLLEGKVIKGQEKTDGNEVIQADITSSKTVEKKSPKRNVEEKQNLLKRESVEKQKAYSDAFID